VRARHSYLHLNQGIFREGLTMAVFCQQCGAALPPGARFCSGCGAVLPPLAYSPGRPLYRPRLGRSIAGVCIGLSQAYGWDVALVRIFAFIGLIFSGGLVFVAYLACWIGIPEEPLPLP
jgi:phage shock protein PspC (stress-responsive transcriptional regulator)